MRENNFQINCRSSFSYFLAKSTYTGIDPHPSPGILFNPIKSEERVHAWHALNMTSHLFFILLQYISGGNLFMKTITAYFEENCLYIWCNLRKAGRI